MIREIIRKLFAADTYFTIAIRECMGAIIDLPRFHASFTVSASWKNWCADPFLAEGEAKTFLFYEKVQGDLGSIEVAEIQPDCSLSAPRQILGGDHHYSYPYVFKKGNSWYMIPESSSQNEVCLYIAETFPYKWKKEKVLLEVPGVDTTVFEFAQKWYMLTFIPSYESEKVTPYAYRIEEEGLIPLQWEHYDPLCVRGAGRPFWYQGALIRPVQLSKAQRYGDQVVFMKIEIRENTYRESLITSLKPNHIKAQGGFFDGLHTYNASSRFEVIDIRRGTLQFSKPLTRICGRIKKCKKGPG